jgi:hypothetical protein
MLVGCSDSRVASRPDSAIPNDEALPGHPLYDEGLRYYALFEVLNSPWLSDLMRQNRVVFPDGTDWPFRPYRHIAVTFQDSTFEALALNVGTQTTNETSFEVFQRFGIDGPDRWRPGHT